MLKALDGRDGAVLWTWNGGASENPQRQVFGWFVLADFEGEGRHSVCLNFLDAKGLRHIVVIDEKGQETFGRDLPENANTYLRVADINGDGRDELLVQYGTRLHVWKSDLTELWSSLWPRLGNATEDIVPASPGSAGTVIIPPAVGLDGSEGHPRWTGQASLNWAWNNGAKPILLDRGNSSRLPTFLTNGPTATVCRSALATTPTGALAPARGEPVPPDLARDDPRWTRSLPWVPVLRRDGAASILVALKRPWTMRLLMALPVAAAVPLTAFASIEPLIPELPAPFPSSSRILFALGSLAGIPIVVLMVTAGWTLVSRRWRLLALLGALTVLASLAIGLIWLRVDFRSMPDIERYTWSGWQLAFFPGAYAAGVLTLLGWVIRGLLGLPKRRR
jgi:hypothetical protein